jgi:hypothetical protein
MSIITRRNTLTVMHKLRPLKQHTSEVVASWLQPTTLYAILYFSAPGYIAASRAGSDARALVRTIPRLADLRQT